jgi:hypothetical protein
VRQANGFSELSTALKTQLGAAMTEATFTDSQGVAVPDGGYKAVIVLGYGESATVAEKLDIARSATWIFMPWALTSPSLATLRRKLASTPNIAVLSLPRSATVPATPFSYDFGNAEAYDATYVAMYAVNGVAKGTPVYKIGGDVLVAGLKRVTDPAGGAVNAARSDIKTGLKQLAADTGTLRVVGSTGTLSFTNDGGSPAVSRTQALRMCALNATGMTCTGAP